MTETSVSLRENVTPYLEKVVAKLARGLQHVQERLTAARAGRT